MTEAHLKVVDKAAAPGSTPAGTSGLKQWHGTVREEFLPQLQDDRGRRIYQEMADNDATVASLLSAIGLMIRPIEWKVEEGEQGSTKEDIDFLFSNLDDMSRPWGAVVEEALTCLVYGWSYVETTYKRRMGPRQSSGAMRSEYSDGRIGIRAMSPRSQDSLDRWEITDEGTIRGWWQRDPATGQSAYLSMTRGVLFRASSERDNPEGKSVLRRAWRSWRKMRNIQDIEAVGIERELAGIPVVRIPSQLLASTAASDVAIRQAYEKIGRDVKFNEQGFVMIPSDVWTDEEGKPGQTYKVSLELLSSSGQRAIDPGEAIRRYQQDICRSVLADFLMLGSGDRGSYAMSASKTDLFVHSCETLRDDFADVLNRYMVRPLWAVNGLPPERCPRLAPGRVARENLDELGKFVSDMVASAVLQPDDELARHLRAAAGLPEGSSSVEV